MPYLKQFATRDNGGTAGSKPYHGVGTTRLIPNTEPTGTAYVAWKAKNYSTTLRNSANSTETGYKCKRDFHQMWRYHKILKKEAKTNATRMAA